MDNNSAELLSELPTDARRYAESRVRHYEGKLWKETYKGEECWFLMPSQGVMRWSGTEWVQHFDFEKWGIGPNDPIAQALKRFDFEPVK